MLTGAQKGQGGYPTLGKLYIEIRQQIQFTTAIYGSHLLVESRQSRRYVW